MATIPTNIVNTQQVPLRLPLVVAPDNRDTTTSKDAKLVNAMAEKTAAGEAIVVKRPGYLALYSTAAGVGNGVYNWLDIQYSVQAGTNLYKNGVFLAALTGVSDWYVFSPLLGAAPKLFFHSQANAFFTDGATVTSIAAATTLTGVAGTATTGSAVIAGIASTAGYATGNTVSGTGIPANAYILTVDSGVQITISAPATITGAVSMTIVKNGIQPSMVPGCAYLDGTMYVMTPTAQVYGSNINDVSTTAWQALNYLTAQIEPDAGVYLAKQLVYVIALKEWSTEVFYNAGNPVGSPLTSVQAHKISYGCVHAGTVAQELENKIVWVSATRSGNIGVVYMEALKVKYIATPAVERILESWSYASAQVIRACGVSIAGHEFYVLTHQGSNMTLVYDFTTGLWSQWTDTSGNFWPIVGSTFDINNKVVLQHSSDGNLYNLFASTTQDNGVNFSVTIVTPNFDAGTRKKKLLSKMDLIADQAATTLSVRVSEDDYLTWSAVRTFNLARKKPQLLDCGSFHKRAWEFVHTDSTALRIYAVELQIESGDM